MDKLLERIQENLKESMRDKDELRVSTLRLLLGAVKNFEIEKGGAGYSANDEEIVSVIQKQLKQRKEAIEQFKSAGRNELAEKEEKEAAILQSYLPEMMGEEEVAKIVEQKISETGASSAADMGKVMGVLSAELKGKADMGLVSKLVKEKLS
jgi:uncharacterized protein YqeY